MRRAIFACAALALWSSAHAATDPAIVARGEYLARMADCEACHVGADGTLSGGRAFRTPFGTVHATNLTPDPKNGVGLYTDDEWVAALQRGVGRSGHLYPAMPYTNYTLMSREDALAIRAWIMTQPASSQATPGQRHALPVQHALPDGVLEPSVQSRPQVHAGCDPRRRLEPAGPIWPRRWVTASNAIRRVISCKV